MKSQVSESITRPEIQFIIVISTIVASSVASWALLRSDVKLVSYQISELNKKIEIMSNDITENREKNTRLSQSLNEFSDRIKDIEQKVR